MLRVGFPCVLAVLLSACSSAPVPGPADELRSFVGFLARTHPAPYAYADEATIEAVVAKQCASLAAAGTADPATFERALRRVVAAYGDAHLEVGYRAGAQPVFLPVLPKRAGAKVFVDAATEVLPPGTELVSIQGRPIAELLAEAALLTSVDGGNAAVRRAEAERRFALLGRVVLGACDRYDVAVRRPDGSEHRLTLAGVGPEGVRALEASRRSSPYWGRAGGTGPWPQLSVIDSKTARLRLPSFAIQDAKAYEARVDEAFASLAGDECLVIDLRGNEGGYRTLGIAVLRHLIDRPFAQWARIQTRVRAVPDAYRDRVRFALAPESVLENFPGTERGDRWVFEGDPLSVQNPSPGVHRGKLVLWIDDATNSAAIEFAVALLEHRDGVTVVGTESQGGCRRHCGELPVVYEFAEMPFVVVVSLFDVQHVETRGGEDGRGVVPDLEVTYSVEDFLEGRDPFLARLRSIPR